MYIQLWCLVIKLLTHLSGSVFRADIIFIIAQFSFFRYVAIFFYLVGCDRFPSGPIELCALSRILPIDCCFFDDYTNIYGFGQSFVPAK